MPGRSWLRIARRVARGKLAPLREQHRITGLRRPCGGRHGEARVLPRHDQDVLRRAPADVGRERVDCGGERERVLPADPPGSQRVGRSRPADLHRLSPAEGTGTGRPQRVERGRGRLRNVLAVGEQDRRAQRRSREHGGGDAGAPVAAVDQGHRARPGAAGHARIDGARGAGGVGERVLAPDAGGVLGRHGREAEHGLLLGLLLELHLDRAVVIPTAGAANASRAAAASAATVRRAAGATIGRPPYLWSSLPVSSAASETWFRPPQGGTMNVG